MDDFSLSFKDSDFLVLLDIYPAGEKPLEGITSSVLAGKIRERGHKEVHCCGDRESTLNCIISQAKIGDTILTLGAGDVWKLGEMILEKLNAA